MQVEFHYSDMMVTTEDGRIRHVGKVTRNGSDGYHVHFKRYLRPTTTVYKNHGVCFYSRGNRASALKLANMCISTIKSEDEIFKPSNYSCFI